MYGTKRQSLIRRTQRKRKVVVYNGVLITSEKTMFDVKKALVS
jgi:hypothetical protein